MACFDCPNKKCGYGSLQKFVFDNSGILRSGCQCGYDLVKVLLLPCRWLLSYDVLTCHYLSLSSWREGGGKEWKREREMRRGRDGGGGGVGEKKHKSTYAFSSHKAINPIGLVLHPYTLT
jgi:hypothetical protein